MNYSEVFSKAWKIIWKFKALWIFGILASCSRSRTSGFSGSSSGSGSTSWFNADGVLAGRVPSLPVNLQTWFLNFQRTWDAEPWVILILVMAFLFVILALIVLSMFLGVLGRVGVARGAWLADDGEEKLGFSRIFNESKPYFWRVFLLFLLIFFVSVALVGILMIPFLLATIFTLGLALVLFIPVMMLASFAVKIIIEQSVVAIVAENKGVFEAIQRAWNLLVKKPWPQIVVGFVVTIGEMGAMFILVLPYLLLMIPLFISIGIDSGSAAWIGAWISGIGALLYSPFVILASGILHAYIGALWALTFKCLTEDELAVVVEEPVAS